MHPFRQLHRRSSALLFVTLQDFCSLNLCKPFGKFSGLTTTSPQINHHCHNCLRMLLSVTIFSALSGLVCPAPCRVGRLLHYFYPTQIQVGSAFSPKLYDTGSVARPWRSWLGRLGYPGAKQLEGKIKHVLQCN